MPTGLSHAVWGAALAIPLRPEVAPRRYWVAAIGCAVIPDVDFLWTYRLDWNDMLAHRGITHSLSFAAACAGVMLWTVFRGPRWDGRRARVWLTLAIAGASHGVLDALSTWILGVAFFAPFSAHRYVFPWHLYTPSTQDPRHWTPAQVADLVVKESLWIVLPALVFAAAALLIQTRRRSTPPAP